MNDTRDNYLYILFKTCVYYFDICPYFSVAIAEIDDLLTGTDCPHTQEANRQKKVKISKRILEFRSKIK